MFCPKCASEVSVTDVRCPKCTQYLGGKPEAAPAPAAKPVSNAEKPVAPVPNAPVAEKPVETKPTETKPVEVKPVEAKPQAVPVSETVGKPEPAQTEAQTKFCAHCGEKIPAAALFCPMCGQKVAVVTPAPVDQKPTPVSMPSTPTETIVAQSAPVQAPVAVETDEPQKNGFSIAGFVLSFLAPLFGLIFSIIGAVKSKSRMGKGKGLSIAGIIISVLNMFISSIPAVFVAINIVRWITMM